MDLVSGKLEKAIEVTVTPPNKDVYLDNFIWLHAKLTKQS